MTVYACEHLWRPDGWMTPAFVAVDASGYVTSIGDAPPSVQAEHVRGYVVPGMPNLHSHAFQRALAGLTEHATGGEDSFWSWRRAMYGFLERLTPDDVEAIANQLYVEMLEAGYTSVGEFQYLHNDVSGAHYANPAETSERLIAAARRAGIGMTLLPVAYFSSGFEGAPTQSSQQRFASDVDWLLGVVERLRDAWRGDPEVRVGVAPHSLRAVMPDALAELVSGIGGLDADAPIHIHVAEQQREVDDCIRARGARPVEWLLANAPVDARWCLVHATHTSSAEIEAVSRSGATLGICPTTEANLGDGIPAFPEMLSAGCHFGIGSDSHVSVDMREELRWLEYAQRLVAQRRNVLGTERTGTGDRLYAGALFGGARALGRAIGEVLPGRRADWLVLDPDHPVLAGRPLERVLDSFLFANQGNPITRVMVGGRWVVTDGRHRDRERTRAEYARVLERLESIPA
jgi:formimidoylglutamate deiminase